MNELVLESSPYLLQHATNPIFWKAWNENTLATAQKENKLLLISIGYAACHWCHVMERESFEDETIAAYMNAHFINVKVDREERPDVDHIYMDALQAMTGSGGWPLNIFLLPDGKPFYGGTYFPPNAMPQRASWMDVLQGVKNAFENNYEKAEEKKNIFQPIFTLKELVELYIDSPDNFGDSVYAAIEKSKGFSLVG